MVCFSPLCCYITVFIYISHEVLQLRQHLSLSMISKLLDGHCTYKPEAEEFKVSCFTFLVFCCSPLMATSPSHTQLSELMPYLPLMRPSSLLRRLQNSSSRNQKDMTTLDQEVKSIRSLFQVCLFHFLNRQCCD